MVAKRLTSRLEELVEKGEVHYIGKDFDEKQLDGMALVFAATDDKKLNHKVSEAARMRGMLVNAVDQPEDCNFIVPAIVRRGDLVIAISTTGKSPALAKMLRERLELQFGYEYEIFLILIGKLRKKILSMGYSQEKNSRIFNEIVRSDIIKALEEKNLRRVEEIFQEILPPDISVKDIFMDLDVLETVGGVL
jgi:precorrin-2 dehydrogenase/sirohydrochlorin ferrochelatase